MLDDFAGNFFFLKVLQRNYACKGNKILGGLCRLFRLFLYPVENAAFIQPLWVGLSAGRNRSVWSEKLMDTGDFLIVFIPI